MSALTEKVAREHVLTYRDEETGDWVCNCGLSIPADLEHMEHVAEVTEAATRAAVAAEIRAAIYPEWVHQFSATVREAFGSGVAHAARIAEGEQ